MASDAADDDVADGLNKLTSVGIRSIASDDVLTDGYPL